MLYASLSDFMAKDGRALGPGVTAILLMEDFSETNSTIRHHLGLGFQHVVVAGPEDLEISSELEERIHRFPHNLGDPTSTQTIVNTIAEARPGQWFYYGYNAEYLFFPFCESRSVGEMTRFVSEERRDSVLTYVIDLYAENLEESPNGVSLETAHLDKSGYFAHSRSRDEQKMERQLDMYGGLRWRFEEHIAAGRHKIDRIGLFRAQKDLKLRDDHTFNLEEYNTYANPWHHNLTAAICSFRAAKSLKKNPSPSECIDSFAWHNSLKFNWHSRQLLDLGLMEPGQWF